MLSTNNINNNNNRVFSAFRVGRGGTQAGTVVNDSGPKRHHSVTILTPISRHLHS